jgi:hypothetical protein
MAYQPLHRSQEQTEVLQQVLNRGHSAGGRGVCVLDLDGCLFDSRHRQIHILREYASSTGDARLWQVKPEHFTNWNMPDTLQAAGVPVELAIGLQEFWFERFFDGEYVLYDHAMPGAAALVHRLHRYGCEIVYLTGRHREMHAGTEKALRRSGFPYDLSRTHLLTKPTFDQDDTHYKERALEEIAALGQAVVFMDNEPANVNLFHARSPDALVVFVETDHSPKPIHAAANLPRIRGFLM